MKKLIDGVHIPPYLYLLRDDDNDVRDIGKHDFRSVLLHPMLADANRAPAANLCYTAGQQPGSGHCYLRSSSPPP